VNNLIKPEMNFIGIIPSRYASTRFPGKPLSDIAGKPMIQRVYEQALKAMNEVWVATDDQRIFDAVQRFGGKVVMTSNTHQSGTDRCAEAVMKVSEITKKDFDVIVNIQGDEPFMQPDQIELIMSIFMNEPATEIATLIQPILKNEDIFRPDMVKVVLDQNSNAIYFSRSPIPHLFGIAESEWIENFTFYGHIGLYAYRNDVLQKLTQLAESKLEKVESLEQLRWLENGFRIKTHITHYDSFGIDTPEDLKQVIAEGIDKYYK
jgi:3-deoxy-manno-octulosonate cytidylyltransferase (CMP-KDO synthetase)